ncbi:Beta-phosphoglucomutase [Cystobacter fuscus DSM 2262]|uniref:Beta-phosphoglucomutase n=1 Tax=Cystobacter fuscus (strain ATCC 25194 / DSM 2262 / NBRC 100088 / M29) TaxID=1242864 RepID=S9QAQ4_CYSF2|nr:HAD family phosphatase [Cystobacter fuscus]EPX58414.1 Beta-phosphoglucomutase [Cystobacter fuscus DSM 2262]
MKPGSSRPYPFEAVLFDLDGVIIDTTDMHYRAWDTFARSHGYIPSQTELLATNGRRADETLRAWFGERLGESELAALVHEREMLFNRKLAIEPVSAIPGVHEFISALRRAGVPYAVGTSAVPMNAELALSRLGLRELFDVLVTAADVTRGKPDPEVYLKAAAALGVPPTACVVFEDSVLGLRAARAAGAKCVALTTSFPRDVLLREEPEWLVEDFRSMPVSVSL